VMGIPLLTGRDFAVSDNNQSPMVGMVNESFLRTYLKGENPIGVRIRWANEEIPVWMTIIGVVGDIKHFGLDQPEEPAFYGLYEQLDQPWKRWMYLTIKSRDNPASIAGVVKSEVHKLDGQLPLTKIQPMNEVLSGSLAGQRFNTILLVVFAGVALLLATVGIYGVVSYSAAQRTHEIGIRMALGAHSSEILALVLKQGLILAISGVGLGLGSALATTRLMKGLLFGVTPTDPLTFATLSVLLVTMTLIASAVPAARASRVDPMTALRYE
ncbi:MAG: FtsX-like permease family protein, partial [Blastocatellia bacterium]